MPSPIELDTPDDPVTVECHDCGTVLSQEDTQRVNGKNMCEACADEYRTCQHGSCTTECRAEDMYRTTDSDYICERCAGRYYTYSGIEEVYVPDDDVATSEDSGEHVSIGYARENWYYCEATYSWYADGDNAPSSESGGLLDYGERVERHCERDSQALAAGALMFGVELEMEPTGGNEQSDVTSALSGPITERYILKSDGSLNDGVELVTVPLTLEQHRAEFDWSGVLKPVRSIAQSGAGTTRCGMHVHINKRALSPLQIGKMLVFLNADSMDEHITRIAQRGSVGFCAKKHGTKVVEGKRISDDRYVRANVGRFTIELRIFRGNLRPERVLKNLEFCHALVTYTKDCSIQELASWNAFATWLLKRRGQYPELVKFLAEAKAPRFQDAIRPNKKQPVQAETVEV